MEIVREDEEEETLDPVETTLDVPAVEENWNRPAASFEPKVGCGILFGLFVVGVVVWLLGLGNVVRESVAAGYLLDWVMGTLCLLWLLLILKAPWDLYFRAHEVAFEIQRSEERGIPIVEGRKVYVARLRQRLGWLAVGAHLFSAAFVAGVTYFTGGRIGYYFAAFYLVATAFRPLAVGYVYLFRKLRDIGKETRYPRADVLRLQTTVQTQAEAIHVLRKRTETLQKALEKEVRVRNEQNFQQTQQREAEVRELRQQVHAIGREFETTVSRVTDNQEVITGIQAFVRLIAQSGSAGS